MAKRSFAASPCIKTIGIVWVAALAESAPCVLSSITITDTSGELTRRRASAADRFDHVPIGIQSPRSCLRRSRFRGDLREKRQDTRAYFQAMRDEKKPITGRGDHGSGSAEANAHQDDVEGLTTFDTLG
jgi:hypothetical protein